MTVGPLGRFYCHKFNLLTICWFGVLICITMVISIRQHAKATGVCVDTHPKPIVAKPYAKKHFNEDEVKIKCNVM